MANMRAGGLKALGVVMELPGASNDKLHKEWEAVCGSKPPIMKGKPAMTGRLDKEGCTTFYDFPLQPLSAPGPRAVGRHHP